MLDKCKSWLYRVVTALQAAADGPDVSCTVCCLAIPADMSVAHFCTFIGAYLNEVRAIQVRCSGCCFQHRYCLCPSYTLETVPAGAWYARQCGAVQSCAVRSWHQATLLAALHLTHKQFLYSVCFPVQCVLFLNCAVTSSVCGVSLVA